MLIIEGIDGSGKTTLAKQLAKDLNIKRYHFGPPPENFKEFQTRCMKSAMLFHRLIIQDRTPFISELMYGTLRESGPFINIEKSRFIIQVNTPILIYCRPERHHMHKMKDYDSQEYFNLLCENWWKIRALYDTYMIQMHAIRYDYTNTKNALITYKRILDLYKKRLKLIDS